MAIVRIAMSVTTDLPETQIPCARQKRNADIPGELGSERLD